MKKTLLFLFVLCFTFGLICLPSCKKKTEKVEYDDVDDDDWKKQEQKTNFDNYYELSSIESSTPNINN